MFRSLFFPTTFLVCENAATGLLVGTDFLTEYDCEVSLRHQTLTLRGCQGDVAVPIKRRSSYKVRRVIAQRSCHVAGRTARLVPGTLKKRGRTTCATQGIVQPAPTLEKLGLLGELSAHSPGERNKTRVLLVNESTEPVIIPRGTVIGTFYPIEDDMPSCGTLTVAATTPFELESHQSHVDPTFDPPLARSPEEIRAELEPMFDFSHISDRSHKEQLLDLLVKYEDIFSRTPEDMGVTNKALHQIETGDAPPVRLPPRRVSPQAKETISQELDKLTRLGFIKESMSPWGAPVVLVNKKDGTKRMCVDYRGLNKVTKKSSWPLPRIDDTIDALSGSKLFSTLDLRAAYMQVPLEESAKEKTAFCTHLGCFEYNRLSFGLCGAPSTFARLMENVLRGLQPHLCMAYLDDNIVHSDEVLANHLANLEAVFKRYREANLKLNPEKCKFLVSEVEFLGHIISGDGVRTDPKKVSAVSDWPTPRTVRQVQQFLGLANYYRRFIKDFSKKAKPLTLLTRKHARFTWTEECANAFSELKQHLVSAPILAYPDFSKPFIVDTDASDVGLGGVLSQVQDGLERVVSYYSRALKPEEQRYCVHRREMLAAVEFITRHECYLQGPEFLLRTDHSALQYLMKMRNPSSQYARWLLLLATYNFRIEHRPGARHGNADGLSRRPCDQCGKTDLDSEPPMPRVFAVSQDDHEGLSPIPALSQHEIRRAQRADPTLACLYLDMQRGTKPDQLDLQRLTREQRTLYSDWPCFEFRDGVLYRNWDRKDGLGPQLQLLLPRTFVSRVLTMVHDEPLGGHLGVDKTLAKLKSAFHWPGMRNDVTAHVSGCETCVRSKGGGRKHRGPMQPSVVGFPNDRVAMDICGPYPKSHKGNKYILVLSDYFTKWVEVFPMADITAESVVKCFYEGWICVHGPPQSLHTDQGSNFDSVHVKDLCRFMKIHKTRTTPYHPQSDGLVERFNRTMGNILRSRVAPHQRDWDEHLPEVKFAYNTSCHATTGFSPYFVQHGREARLPIHLMVRIPTSVGEVHQHVEAMQTRLPLVFQQVQEHTQQQQRRQKELYDEKTYGKPYAVGDTVFLLNKQVGKGLVRKLTPRAIGPFAVVRRIGDLVYEVRNTRGRQQLKVVHFENLIPFSPTQADPDYNPRDDGRRRPARPNRNRTPALSLSESPVTSGEESSQGSCLASVSGSDQQSDDDGDSGRRTRPKVPVRRQPAYPDPDVSSASDDGPGERTRPKDVAYPDPDCSSDYLTCSDDPETSDQGKTTTRRAVDVSRSTPRRRSSSSPAVDALRPRPRRRRHLPTRLNDCVAYHSDSDTSRRQPEPVPRPFARSKSPFGGQPEAVPRPFGGQLEAVRNGCGRAVPNGQAFVKRSLNASGRSFKSNGPVPDGPLTGVRTRSEAQIFTEDGIFLVRSKVMAEAGTGKLHCTNLPIKTVLKLPSTGSPVLRKSQYWSSCSDDHFRTGCPVLTKEAVTFVYLLHNIIRSTSQVWSVL
ncbi:GIN1 [Branchiostoma lanceolatum]|uniref:Gypsy retrotransposon integrase-like protein 1 n=1 Tax=Branchiostoma lanceolatum TaxID=7740 RepID=A0A8K0EMI2_BRALA|nr:GIN1 [Branchiostoma lanceolatum]